MTRFWRITRRVGLVCGVLLLLAYLGWRIAWAHHKQEFEIAIEKMRASGVPTDLVAFNRESPPAADNAAPMMRAALTWLEERELGYAPDDIYLESIPDTSLICFESIKSILQEKIYLN